MLFCCAPSLSFSSRTWLASRSLWLHAAAFPFTVPHSRAGLLAREGATASLGAPNSFLDQDLISNLFPYQKVWKQLCLRLDSGNKIKKISLGNNPRHVGRHPSFCFKKGDLLASSEIFVLEIKVKRPCHWMFALLALFTSPQAFLVPCVSYRLSASVNAILHFKDHLHSALTCKKMLGLDLEGSFVGLLYSFEAGSGKCMY